MLKKHKLMLLLSLFGFIMASCDKDDAPPDDEQELITTVKLTFTNTASTAEVVTATWRDTDGPGGAAPVITGLFLKPNTSYNGRVEFLDESNPNNTADITEEVEQEGEDHQVYYTATGNLTVSNLNNDSKGLPLGTRATFTTTAAGIGTLKVVLKHKPGSKAAGDQETKGETDVEVIFPVQIQ
jgi:YD repeat-containing protein